MKIDWSFLRIVLYWLGGVGAVTAFLLPIFLDGEILKSIVAALLITVFNLTIGYLAIEYSFHQPNTTFLKIVLGGMAFRMFLLLTLVVLLIRVFDFHITSLMLSLLLFYSFTLVLEIYFLQKKVSLKE